MLFDDFEWWEEGLGEVSEGGDLCILIADSCSCTAETNKTL